MLTVDECESLSGAAPGLSGIIPTLSPVHAPLCAHGMNYPHARPPNRPAAPHYTCVRGRFAAPPTPETPTGGAGQLRPCGTPLRAAPLPRLAPHRLLDLDRRAVRRLLQRLSRQMGVAHGDLGVGVAQDLLDFVQGSPTVD